MPGQPTLTGGWPGGRRTSRPVRRILCAARTLRGLRRRRPSISACRCRQAPAAYPQTSGGQPSSVCAGSSSCGDGPCLALLRVGFTEPPRSPGVLVGSYPTVSPLPSPLGSAVCFLWHFPAGRPGLPLTTTLPCGVRTFLGGGPKPADAAARSTRPSRSHPNDERAAGIAAPPEQDRAAQERSGECVP